jgi:lysophospholipase L1-like esterase
MPELSRLGYLNQRGQLPVDDITVQRTVQYVKPRLALTITALVTLIGSLGVLETVERQTEPRNNVTAEWSMLPGVNDQSNEVWVRENWYTNYSNYLWQGFGPVLQLNQLADTYKDIDRIKVLAVGDSFVWGTGLQDFNERWPNRLQIELDQAAGTGVFDVVPLATMGASTMEQAEFLEANINSLEPDLIVLGLLFNDSIPSGREKSVCKVDAGCRTGSPELLPEYQECITGSGDFFSRSVGFLAKRYRNIGATMLERYCDLERFAAKYNLITQQDIYEQPTKSPYRKQFLDSVQLLRQTTANIPFLVYPTSVSRLDYDLNQKLLTSFEAAGFDTIPVDQNFLGKNSNGHVAASTNDIIANPADYHPGPFATRQFARDIAEAVLAKISSEKIAAVRTSIKTSNRQLVNGHLPVALTITSNDDKTATVVIDENATLPVDAPKKPRPGSPMLNQNAPCALLNAPHARIGLNPALVRSGTLRVTLEKGTSAVLYVASHQENGNRVVSRIGTLNSGSTLSVDLENSDVSALLIVEEGRDCSADDPLTLNTRTIQLNKED